MPRFVLDTDLLTLFREGHPEVCRKVGLAGPDQVVTTAITVEESLSGWYSLIRSVRRPDQLEMAYEALVRTSQFFSHLPILGYSQAAMARYGQLRALKLNVGGMDLRIAAIALEAQAIVVTRNLRDFRRVPGLTAEDWSQP